jgi:hypothetical protein
MSFRIGLLLGLLVVLSLVLFFMPMDGFKNLDTSSPAPVIEREPTIYPARRIVESGPNSPNQMAHPDEVRMSSPEVANDPYMPNEESASHPERLRHPERMYQPAPQNTTHEIAEASGIANSASVQASNAMGSFTPEFAQNGGEFMQGIMANDSSEPGMYSAF